VQDRAIVTIKCLQKLVSDHRASGDLEWPCTFIDYCKHLDGPYPEKYCISPAKL